MNFERLEQQQQDTRELDYSFKFALQKKLVLQEFSKDIARKPYCKNDFDGSKLNIKTLKQSKEYKNIQHNNVNSYSKIAIDIDNEVNLLAKIEYLKENCAKNSVNTDEIDSFFNILVSNKKIDLEKFKGHINIYIETVHNNKNSSRKAIEYYNDIKECIYYRMNADTRYNNFMTKNPYRDDAYDVRYLSTKRFSLNELAIIFDLSGYKKLKKGNFKNKKFSKHSFLYDKLKSFSKKIYKKEIKRQSFKEIEFIIFSKAQELNKLYYYDKSFLEYNSLKNEKTLKKIAKSLVKKCKKNHEFLISVDEEQKKLFLEKNAKFRNYFPQLMQKYRMKGVANSVIARKFKLYEKVKEAQELYSNNKCTKKELAKLMNVSYATVRNYLKYDLENDFKAYFISNKSANKVTIWGNSSNIHLETSTIYNSNQQSSSKDNNEKSNSNNNKSLDLCSSLAMSYCSLVNSTKSETAYYDFNNLSVSKSFSNVKIVEIDALNSILDDLNSKINELSSYITDLLKSYDINCYDFNSLSSKFVNYVKSSLFSKNLYEEFDILSSKLKDLNSYKSKYKNVLKLKSKLDVNNSVKTNYRLASTHRINTYDFALQSISKDLRYKLFTSNNNYKLVAFDYSQIELKVLAHLSQDEFLLNSFKNNKDVHNETAKSLNISRDDAKVVNFGISYGMTAFGLASNLNISYSKAQDIINNFYKTYKSVKTLKDNVEEFAIAKDFVVNLFNRRINLNNKKRKDDKKKFAFNSIIQSSAADIVSIATQNIIKYMNLLNNDEIKIVLNLHDELVFEVKDNENFIKNSLIIKYIMQHSTELDVSLDVNDSINSVDYDSAEFCNLSTRNEAKTIVNNLLNIELELEDEAIIELDNNIDELDAHNDEIINSNIEDDDYYKKLYQLIDFEYLNSLKDKNKKLDIRVICNVSFDTLNKEKELNTNTRELDIIEYLKNKLEEDYLNFANENDVKTVKKLERNNCDSRIYDYINLSSIAYYLKTRQNLNIEYMNYLKDNNNYDELNELCDDNLTYIDKEIILFEFFIETDKEEKPQAQENINTLNEFKELINNDYKDINNSFSFDFLNDEIDENNTDSEFDYDFDNDNNNDFDNLENSLDEEEDFFDLIHKTRKIEKNKDFCFNENSIDCAHLKNLKDEIISLSQDANANAYEIQSRKEKLDDANNSAFLHIIRRKNILENLLETANNYKSAYKKELKTIDKSLNELIEFNYNLSNFHFDYYHYLNTNYYKNNELNYKSYKMLFCKNRQEKILRPHQLRALKFATKDYYDEAVNFFETNKNNIKSFVHLLNMLSKTNKEKNFVISNISAKTDDNIKLYRQEKAFKKIVDISNVKIAQSNSFAKARKLLAFDEIFNVEKMNYKQEALLYKNDINPQKFKKFVKNNSKFAKTFSHFLNLANIYQKAGFFIEEILIKSLKN